MIRPLLILIVMTTFNANAFFFGDEIDFEIRNISKNEAISIMEDNSILDKEIDIPEGNYDIYSRALNQTYEMQNEFRIKLIESIYYKSGMYILHDKVLIPFKPMNLSKETLARIKNTDFLSCTGTLSVGSYSKEIRFARSVRAKKSVIDFKNQSFVLRSTGPVNDYNLSDYDNLSISCEPRYDEDEDITLNVEIKL